MKQHILQALVDGAALMSGDKVKALYHKSSDPDKRNSVDREKRSTCGQFASIQGRVSTIKQTSTGLQVMIARTDGHEKPFGSLTSNQVIRSLEVNGIEVML